MALRLRFSWFRGDRGRLPRRWRRLAIASAVCFAIFGIALLACGLNPQPLPPGDVVREPDPNKEGSVNASPSDAGDAGDAGDSEFQKDAQSPDAEADALADAPQDDAHSSDAAPE